ncbi:23 kDa integral membrane protein-like [Cloeon dipterum]|uniref:23 kDa integral membrane protein-like n=1 Tax=Cloeon dipterum TaxID=197152 RepID=UPI00321FCB4F
MGVGTAFIRWGFVIYDLCLGLLSSAATVFAAWVLIEVLNYGYFLDVTVVAAPSIALLLGALLLLPSIVVLGFRAFTTKKSTLAIIYWLLVATSAILALALSCWTLFLRHKVQAGYLAHKIVNPVLVANPKSLEDAKTKHYWDALQASLKCCGLNGAADYRSTGSLPMSCCDVVEQVCSKTYPRGCSVALTEFSADKLAQITIVAAVTSLVLLLGVYAGCSYSRSLQHEKKRRRRNAALDAELQQEQLPLNASNMRTISMISSLPRKSAPPVPPKPSPRYVRSASKNSAWNDETMVHKVG